MSHFIIRSIISLAISGILAGCSSGINNVEEYNEWLSNNKCIITKNIAGVNTTVKYTPPAYIALKDLRKAVTTREDKLVYDSLLKKQESALTFLLTIAPDKHVEESKRASSIMYEGVANQEQFSERVLEVNFFMDQNIKLFVDGAEQKPALVLVENIYELSDSRTFVVVFASREKETLSGAGEYLFEYDDPFYNLGKVQFRFSGKDLSEARKVSVL